MMDAPRIRRVVPVSLPVLAALLTVLSSPGIGAVYLPRVPETPDLSWRRQPLFRSISRWDVPSLLPLRTFPKEQRDSSPSADPALRLYRDAVKAEETARRKGYAEGSGEAAARLFLQAQAAFGKGDRGILCMDRAARLFFLAGRYLEAEDLAKRLIRKSGGRTAAAPYFLLQGESLLHRGNVLAARECFRQAASGRWDPETVRKLSFRIADASALLENVGYASTRYRRIFRSPEASFRKYPAEAIRYGEALLQAGNPGEALAVFRAIRNEPLPRAVLAAAALGEGDALLILEHPGEARAAYRNAEGSGISPEEAEWLRCRLADLDFLSGARKEAAAQYRTLAKSLHPDIAREARYKWILSLYLLGDRENLLRVVGESYFRNDDAPGAANIRRMAAEAGTSLVRAAASDHPARLWTAFHAFLFSFSGSPAGNRLCEELGTKLEADGLWTTAAILYRAAGSADRREAMGRIAALEQAYFRDPPEEAIRLLDSWSDAEKASPELGWLAAKAYFRAGRYRESSILLQGLDSPSRPARGEEPPRQRELAATLAALAGDRSRTRILLDGWTLPGGSPLSYLDAWSVDSPRKESGASKRPLPETGSDPLWEKLTDTLERYRRAIPEKDG